ncbi:spore germination protein [Actinomycetes bacterium NPDC127524]
MKNSIQVENFIVNEMSGNANINFGRTVQNSHTANFKIAGLCQTFGSHSPAYCCMKTFISEFLKKVDG